MPRNFEAMIAAEPDAFLGGRLRIEQARDGYRAGLDAMLLAASVPEGASLIEAGCGPGAALLAVALRFPDARLVGVERDSAAADMAERNVAANGLSDRVKILCADALDPTLPLAPADGAFCNPPYLRPGEGVAPAAARLAAHQADQPFEAWAKALSNRLTGGAALTVIHRADRLPEILAALEGRLGGVRVRPIHPRVGEAAHRVLVMAVKGSRAPFRLLAPLVVHQEDGAFTHPADAMLRGEAYLDWT